MVMNTVRQHYPTTTLESDYIRTTAAVLAPLGFTSENTLPILSICRDEICGSFATAAQSQWGNSFTLGGLAGLPFGGKTGIGAASHHAPDIHDRERFVIYAMAHIGFGPQGEIGGCVRPGMEHLNGACGALIGYTGLLANEDNDTTVFADDAEFGLLKQRMGKVVPNGKPDLIAVTKAAQQAIKQDIASLTSTVLDTKKADYAVFTGTQVHLPDMHLVAASDSWVMVNAERRDINFSA